MRPGVKAALEVHAGQAHGCIGAVGCGGTASSHSVRGPGINTYCMCKSIYCAIKNGISKGKQKNDA